MRKMPFLPSPGRRRAEEEGIPNLTTEILADLRLPKVLVLVVIPMTLSAIKFAQGSLRNFITRIYQDIRKI